MHITRVKRKWSGDPAENRNKFIGGSDVGTVLGLNPFKSAFELWCEKTGRIEPEDISDREQIWWGVQEEGLVAKRFCMKTGKRVKKSGFEFTCEEYPFLVAHVDRLLLKESAVLECKTTSSWNKFDYKNGEVPPSHFAQLMFYLHMTGLNTGYLATKRDNQFYINTVTKDHEFIEEMMDRLLDFWYKVENDIPPEIDDSESTARALTKMYGKDDPEKVVDLSQLEETLDAMDSIKANMAQMKTLQTGYENKIKAFMKDATKGTTEHHTVTWKATRNGSRVFRVNRT